jgi:hypothetical protein
MAKRLAIPSKELALTIVGPASYYKAARVQRLELSSDVPNTVVDELGNPNHAGTVSDIANVTLTFDAFDVGIKLFSVLTGTDATAYPGAGVNIDQLGEIDAIIYVKSPTVADYVKSAHAKRMQITDFSYSFNVTGEATESYTATGSAKRWFKYDVIVDVFTTGTTSFSLTETPIQLRNGDYLLSVILDGEYLTEVASGEETGEYSVSGTTLTTADTRTSQVVAVYHANPAGDNWTDVSDATMPAAIRGQYSNIIIVAEDIPRVQSITINGTMNVQPVQEMGNPFIVGYQRQTPNVDGTLTVLDTDNELLALLTTGEINPSGVVEYLIEGACTASGIPLYIKMYDPCDTDTVLKTYKIPELVVTGDSHTQNVNENAQVVFNWVSDTAEVIVYSGEPA